MVMGRFFERLSRHGFHVGTEALGGRHNINFRLRNDGMVP